MNQLNLIAIPNGVFTLEDTLIKELIQNLQAAEVTETDKIKAFLTLYQMIDTLAQLHLKGFDMNQVNQAGLEKNMKYVIDTSSCTLAQERGKVKHEPRVTSVSLMRTSKQKASHLTGFFIVLLTILKFQICVR